MNHSTVATAKIGDEVISIVPGTIIGTKMGIGMKGKIIDILKESNAFISIGVEFEKNIGGHDCNNKGKDGFCRYFYENIKKDDDDDRYNTATFQSVRNLAFLKKEQLEFEF